MAKTTLIISAAFVLALTGAAYAQISPGARANDQIDQMLRDARDQQRLEIERRQLEQQQQQLFNQPRLGNGLLEHQGNLPPLPPRW